ncbi:hypothetical protein QBC35DRAFT_541186 [Podospora australis]|uniref:Uncharacterized protein n=1 Tax=Podospora australis TaxID=1536484 RepID=A0AAN6WPP0_9PEZI|nr:hypothetical protein QBC35DRAFT_541186 [Podospora australis]
MSRLLWAAVLLFFLAVDVLAKSDVGAAEKIGMYMLYRIMYRYTTKEGGEGDWDRTKMPLLPHLNPTQKGDKKTNKGLVDPSRGLDSGMLEFPDFLDALMGYEPYGDGSLARHDMSAREKPPPDGIKWTDDFDKLAAKVKEGGFMGTVKMHHARGLREKKKGDTYAKLYVDLNARLEMAQKNHGTNKAFLDEVKQLKPLVANILDQRKAEFGKYIPEDIALIFFSKTDDKGKYLKYSNPRSTKEVAFEPEDRASLKKNRIPIEGTKVHTTNGDIHGPTDITKTLESEENKAAFKKRFGVKTDKNVKKKLEEWIKDYGKDKAIPQMTWESKAHLVAMKNWEVMVNNMNEWCS